MKKLILCAGIIALVSFALALSAEAHYEWWGNHYYENDYEYDWVIKPEVLGDKLRIIANPAFIPRPRCGESVVITGDPDRWNYTWQMDWSDQGYVANIPLSKLPKNKRIRMNYLVRGGKCNETWAQYSWDNDYEWTGLGDHGKVIIDFMIQGRRVVPVD